MSTSIDPEANLLPDQTRPNMPISEQEKANYMEPGAPNSPLNLKNDHDVATYSGHDGASSQEVGHSVGQGTDKPNITPNDPDKGTRLTTKKNVQAVQSDRLVEDRIQAIEAQVKALLGNSQPTSSTQAQPPLASKNSQLQALAPVRDSSGKFENKPVLVPLDEFRVTPQVGRFNESEYEEAYEFTGLKKCAVDLLIPDGGGEAPKKGALTPEYPDVSPAANKTESEDRAVSNDELQPSTTISATSTASSKPKRARINSRKLLIDLLDVAGQVRDTLGRQFLAPFQIFTLHEDKIRRRVEELERQCSRKDTTLEVKEVAPAPKEEDCSKSSQDAHRDLEMVDQEIGADILEIMERCQVGIQKAGDAFHAQRSSVSSKTSGAISDILRSMTEEERGMVDNLYTKSLLEEWKCLIDFLDTDLRSTLETCAQIREGTLKVIAYEDLMYLFNPGDIVLSHQNRRLQALAVLTASGGRPLLYKPPAYHRFSILDRSEEPFLPADKQNPFTVSCWYYDFDGVTAGMVSKRFLIPKYDGVKTVTPPPISPANLHTFRGREILEHLTQRGNKYVALCSEKAGAHRQYRARTLDDTPEEVDSQVIVDYQMAALVQPEKLPDQSQWIPVLGMDPPKELDSREIYESASLRRVAIFNDNRMNRGRAILYINSWGFIDDNMEIENTEPKFRMLFPPPVFGFILRSRKWGTRAFRKFGQQPMLIPRNSASRCRKDQRNYT